MINGDYHLNLGDDGHLTQGGMHLITGAVTTGLHPVGVTRWCNINSTAGGKSLKIYLFKPLTR